MLLSGRWKIDSTGAKINHPVSKRPILQFVSIQRKDCREWAIPGVGGFYISSSFIDVVCCFALTLCHLLLCFSLCLSRYPHSYSRKLRTTKVNSHLSVHAYFVGDGGSRGAGFSHTTAGVFGRSVELTDNLAIKESRNPSTHHWTLQIARVSGLQLTKTNVNCDILVNKWGKRKTNGIYSELVHVKWMPVFLPSGL